MAENRRVFREGRVSAEEAERLNDIRGKVLEEFPPDPNHVELQAGIASI